MKDQTRRQFMATAAASAAIVSPSMLSARSVVARQPRPGQPSQLSYGLVTYLWGKDLDLPALIKTCEQSNVLGVELRSTHRHGVEPSLNKAQRADVKKRFADSPVTCVGPGSNERYDNPKPDVVKKAIEATKGYIKLSHDIGSTGVKVKPDRFYREVPREKTIEQIGRSLNELGAFAKDYGQEIRLEVHGQCAELPTIRAIMDVADHPSVGVCWNSNGQDLQGKGLDHNFNLVRSRFGATAHVREFDLGGYPYPRLIELMVGSDYRGWVMLEGRKIPKDKVAGLKAQRELFEKLVAAARAKKK